MNIVYRDDIGIRQFKLLNLIQELLFKLTTRIGRTRFKINIIKCH